MRELGFGQKGTRAKSRQILALLLIELALFGIPAAKAAEHIAARPSLAYAPSRQPNAADAMFFNIPSQPLAKALDAFARTAGIQLIYNSRLADGRTAPWIKGTYTIDEALDALLADSGLTPRRINDNVLTLMFVLQETRFVSPPPPAAPLMPLDTLHVLPPSAHEYLIYANNVENAIRVALLHNRRIHRTNYDTKISVWVSASGSIFQCNLRESTGRPELDVAIVNTVQDIDIGQSPPSGLPQPIYVDIAGGMP
jgi:hypothetical protein